MKKAWMLLFLILLVSCSTTGSQAPEGLHKANAQAQDLPGISETAEETVTTGEEPASAGQVTGEKSTSSGGRTGANPEGPGKDAGKSLKPTHINKDGKTVEERIGTPEGFERVKVEEGSFGHYLRTLPLKPDGTKVHYYNGGIKPVDVHAAVLDIDIGTRDLQQCADAVIRLRAEYLYGKGLYDKIHFNFTNGFRADYTTWMQGNRIAVEGNKAYWVKRTGYSDDYESFRRYLDMVFAYAGSLSLSREMENIPVEGMQAGDVFIEGGLPGHTAIVLDMAENKDTGEKIFILAQSYMPAQDIHILRNPSDDGLSPWYSTGFGNVLDTPEWQFDKDRLYRFKE
ncbi:MAG: DUF4846 domain-containing protein [Bacillota bacterium]